MNIVVISLAGIGNTLLATPAIELLRKRSPEAQITLLVSDKVYGEVVEGSPYVDEILVFERKDIIKKLIEKLRFILMLRKRRFDVSITGFPSNRMDYNLFAFLIGAKRRITHKYRVGRFSTLSFLQNVKVPAIYGKHDVEQNLGLLRPLGINPLDGNGNLIMWVTDTDKEHAREFLLKNNIAEDEIVIGMHPGSGGQIAKRWAKEKFADLGDALCKKYSARVLLFGGPDEAALKQDIFTLMKNKPILVQGTLKETAAVISRCNLFISNDSGLMHIATVMGVPTIAIFGPTDPQRTRPWGEKNTIVAKEMPCSPCLKYPFFNTNSSIECQEAKCLSQITVDDVIQAIEKQLSLVRA